MWPEDTQEGRREETNYSGTEDEDIWREDMMDSKAGRKDTQINPLRLIPQDFYLLCPRFGTRNLKFQLCLILYRRLMFCSKRKQSAVQFLQQKSCQVIISSRSRSNNSCSIVVAVVLLYIYYLFRYCLCDF